MLGSASFRLTRLLYASETRSSSPVRVVRGEDGQAGDVRGLYPCGEGAGYAGGIVSSGVSYQIRKLRRQMEHTAELLYARRSRILVAGFR